MNFLRLIVVVSIVLWVSIGHNQGHDRLELPLEVSNLLPCIRVEHARLLKHCNALLQPIALVLVPLVVFFGQRVAELETAALPPVEIDHREHVEHSVGLLVVLLEHLAAVGLFEVLLRPIGHKSVPNVQHWRNAVQLTDGVVSGCEDIELRIRFSLLLHCVHALKDHILVPYLTLLVLSVLVELDLFFELPASFGRPYLVPHFLDRLHVAQTDLWHVIRRHGRQEAQVEHDEGDFVASGHLLELRVVALREGPAHFARHQGAH